MTISTTEKSHAHSHLARVRLPSNDRRAELTELLQQRSGPGEGEGGTYLWDAEISNTLLDTYYTHMSEKTLRNYAEDAERGVAFLRGHDWKSLPVGYSLTGKYIDTDDRKRVVAGFYTVRGLSDTDDLIARMEAQLLRDVSVGFYGGRTLCDICGQDFWDCRHFPGLTYEEKQGDVVRSILSTFTIDDAHLAEVSGVFDGSTPEAMIRKAEVVARAGELSPEQVQLIESRYRIALPHSATYRGVAIPATQERTMTEQDVLKVRTMLGLGAEGDVVASVETLQATLDDAHKRIAALEPQAAEGVQYRTDLIEDALAEGVRAQGADFKRSLYEATLKVAPLEVVKQMRDDWKRIADMSLPAGRTSTDDVERLQAVPSLMADNAYRV